jgi:hypothetical protein
VIQLRPETQQRVLKVLYDFSDALAHAFGFESSGYEDTIRFVRAESPKYGVLVPTLALGWANKIIPGGGDPSVEPEKFDEYLAQIDTKEKAEALFLGLPEPDPQWLESTLTAIEDELPRLRQQVLPMIKALPHYHRGGRKTELADPETRRKIREELKTLRSPGVNLDDLYERLAQRYDVSASTIKRIRFEETDDAGDVQGN